MTNTHWTPEETTQLLFHAAQRGNLSGAWSSQNNQQDTKKKRENPCGKIRDWVAVQAAMPTQRGRNAYNSKWSKTANEIYHATAGMTFRDRKDPDDREDPDDHEDPDDYEDPHHHKDPDHHKLLVRAAVCGYMVGPIHIKRRYNAPPPPPGGFPLVPPLAAAEAADAAAAAAAAAGGSGGRARAATAATTSAAAPSADQEVAMADMEVDEEYYDDVPAAAANTFAAFSSGPAPAPAPAPRPGFFPPPPRWPGVVELGGPYLDHIMQFPWDWRQEYRRALQEELDELDRREGEVQFNEFL